MPIFLKDYQADALKRIKNGSILCGGVGSGKSITSIAYYYLKSGGSMSTLLGGEYIPMGDLPGDDDESLKDLYIITTARKRDTKEWDKELANFLLSTDPSVSLYTNKIVIDSWNNIGKYKDVTNAFFIFDEQRVVGSGAWVKAFLRITKFNKWILLSATPGDSWSDYIPVFIANGFYKNKTEFAREHIVYSRFSKNYPVIDRYINTGRLLRYKNDILVNMDYERPATPHNIDVYVDWDKEEYKWLCKNRWNKETDEPIENASELCYAMRRIVNTGPERIERVKEIVKEKSKVIIFYNFDYELEILKSQTYFDKNDCICEIAEWNGHKHQPIPSSDCWVYLVQYTAGAEGWNCIETDTIIFYSQNYSYKIMVQSSGRIDRMNTPFEDLYYYHLKSKSGIDLAISKALKSKKKFNELKYVSII